MMAGGEAGKEPPVQSDASGAGASRRSRRTSPTIELSAAAVTSSPAVDVSAAAAEAVSSASISVDPAGTAGAVPPAAEPATAPKLSESGPKAEAQRPAAAAPTAAFPAAKPQPASPSRLGGMIAGAVTGIVGGLAASLAIVPFLRPAVPDHAPRLAAIEAAQGQLARGAAVTELTGEVTRLKATIEGLRAELGQQVDGQKAAVETRLSALDLAAKQLGEKLDGLSVPVAGGGIALDIGPLTRKVEEISGLQATSSQKLAEVEQAARSTAETAREAGDRAGAALSRLAAAEEALKAVGTAADSAAEGAKQALSSATALPQKLAPEMSALGDRLQELSRRQDAATAAPVLAAVQALAAAFRRGDPFTIELSALEALRLPAAKTADLLPFAGKGAPTPAALSKAFQPLASDLARSGEQAGGVAGVLSRFVSVRPVGEAQGNQPPALVARIEAALQRGDTAQALADWALLPEPARKLSAAFAETLGQRDRATKALTALEKEAIEQLRKGGS